MLCMVKADLHIHTRFSKYPTSEKEPFKFLGIQDCYVTPEEAYKTAKRKFRTIRYLLFYFKAVSLGRYSFTRDNFYNK